MPYIEVFILQNKKGKVTSCTLASIGIQIPQICASSQTESGRKTLASCFSENAEVKSNFSGNHFGGNTGSLYSRQIDFALAM